MANEVRGDDPMVASPTRSDSRQRLTGIPTNRGTVVAHDARAHQRQFPSVRTSDSPNRLIDSMDSGTSSGVGDGNDEWVGRLQDVATYSSCNAVERSLGQWPGSLEDGWA